MVERITKRDFYRGLLYALRLRRQTFDTEGQAFHRAFGEVMRFARENPAADTPLPVEVHLNPLFSVYPEATEMLLEGEQDHLVSLLNPTLQRATFNVSENFADKQLSRLPHADWFRELGRRFDEQLGR